MISDRSQITNREAAMAASRFFAVGDLAALAARDGEG